MWYIFHYPKDHKWFDLDKEISCPVCHMVGEVVLQTSNSAYSYGLESRFKINDPDRACCKNCGTIFDHEILLKIVAPTLIESIN